MINKIPASAADALANIKDSATVLIGGFGGAGQPAATRNLGPIMASAAKVTNASVQDIVELGGPEPKATNAQPYSAEPEKLNSMIEYT